MSTTIELDSLRTPDMDVYRPHKGFAIERPDYTKEECDEIAKFAVDCKISSLVAKQTPLAIESTMSSIEALKTLAKRSVMSAPVIDVATKRIVGLLDYRDLCSLLCRAYEIIRSKEGEVSVSNTGKRVSPTSASQANGSKVQKGEDMESVADCAKESKICSKGNHKENACVTLDQLLQYAPVGDVTNFSRRNCFFSVSINGTLADALELFAKGIHRVIVLDNDGHFAGVVSQSDAVQVLQQHISDPAYARLASKTLTDLNLVIRKVSQGDSSKDNEDSLVTVGENDSVIKALQVMEQRGYSSICMTGSTGIIGSFSMNDFKYFLKQEIDGYNEKQSILDVLEQSCSSFVQKIMLARDKSSGFQTRLPVFHCSPSTTMERLVRMICAIRTHRIWVTKDNNMPIAVITLSDILYVSTPSNISRFEKLRERGLKPIQFTPSTSADGPM